MQLDTEGRRQLRAATRRIRESLDRAGVCRGLPESHAKQLVEQICFIDQMQRRHEHFKSDERRATRFFERGPGQLRRLRTRIDHLQTALGEVERQIATICGDENTPSGNVYLAALLHAHNLPDRLAKVATLVRELDAPTEAVFGQSVELGVSVEPPHKWVTKRLHDLFTNQFGVGSSDASQRIAKIGNALWGWNVQDTDPDSRTPNRSGAILKRLKRHRS